MEGSRLTTEQSSLITHGMGHVGSLVHRDPNTTGYHSGTYQIPEKHKHVRFIQRQIIKQGTKKASHQTSRTGSQVDERKVKMNIVEPGNFGEEGAKVVMRKTGDP